MLLILLSITSLIKTFLVVIIFFMIIRWISKLFSPRYSQGQQNTQQKNQPREGETTIHVKNHDKKNDQTKKGEYVDFEEIE